MIVLVALIAAAGGFAAGVLLCMVAAYGGEQTSRLDKRLDEYTRR